MSNVARVQGIPFLLLCLLTILALSGCGDETPRATAPAATAPVEWTDLDIKQLVRDLLKDLPADWNQISAENVAKAGPFVVDVRQPEEYAEGFIEGAVNIPLRELAASLEALPAMDQDTVLVDSSGHRSAVGMAVLQMLGYRQAKSLEGGMQAWQQADLSVVTAPVPGRPEGQVPEVNAQLRAMLDYYLGYTLPVKWGAISSAGLTDDQNRLSSAEREVQPESFDQGRSLLVDVDEPEEFAEANLPKDINVPLRGLPDNLDDIPLEETIRWS